MANYHCFACHIDLNGPTQLRDHLGITSGRGKKHKQGVKQVQRAVEQGTVLPSADQGDPVWVIGAQNFLDRFKPMHEQVTLQNEGAGREGVARLLQLERRASLRWCDLKNVPQSAQTVPTRGSYPVRGCFRGSC